jgi:O-antigen/teichoic acid export membrane protein
VRAATATVLEERPTPLRRAVGWAFAGNAGYALSQWAMLAMLAKRTDPEAVGLFALATAITAPVMMLASLQLRSLQATDARDEYTPGDYLALRILTTALAVLAFLALALVLGGQVGFILLMVGLAKAFEAMSDVLFGRLQRQERMDQVGRALMLKALVTPLAWATGLAWAGVAGAVTGMAVAWGITFFAVDLPAALRSGAAGMRPNFDRKRLAPMALLAAPLGVTMMLISLNTNLPRYFLERDHGPYALGIFAALAYLLVAGNMIMMSVSQSVAPRLSRHYAAGELPRAARLLARMIALAAAAGVASVALGAFAGEWLLGLLYTPEYAGHADVLVWVLVAGALGYVGTMLGSANTASRRIRPQMAVQATVTGVTVLLGAMLIPGHGLLGAAWTLCGAATVRLIGVALIQARTLKGAP